MRTLIVLLFLLINTPGIMAQQSSAAPPPNRCLNPLQKQLDFWVGEWDLTWPGANASETAHGSNSVKRILDGCIVQENFSGLDSMPLRGEYFGL